MLTPSLRVLECLAKSVSVDYEVSTQQSLPKEGWRRRTSDSVESQLEAAEFSLKRGERLYDRPNVEEKVPGRAGRLHTAHPPAQYLAGPSDDCFSWLLVDFQEAGRGS